MIKERVYRAIDKPLTTLSSQYSPGHTVCWIGFTSTSKSREKIKEFISVDKEKKPFGTLMLIDVIEGKDISCFSFYPEEKELLLLPNSSFVVKEVVSNDMKYLVDIPASVDAIVLTQQPTPIHHLLMKRTKEDPLYKKKEMSSSQQLQGSKGNEANTIEPNSDVWLINKDELTTVGGGELGKNPGKLYIGRLSSMAVAVKELKKIKELDQFKKDICIMARLRHPNVVLFLGASYEPTFIVTELLDLERGDLHKIIEGFARQNSFPMNEALKQAIGIAQGMSYLHCCSPPIIHKDLKPKNILLDSLGHPKIINFGLSEEQEIKETDNKESSAPWKAPELLKGYPYSEKTDVYAFGIILFQLSSGSTSVQKDYLGCPSIPQAWATRELALVELIKKCCEASPEKRPTFKEIVDSLIHIFLVKFLRDESAIKMWKTKFGDAIEGVPAWDFCDAFWGTVYSGGNAPDSKDLERKQKCLEAVAFTGSIKTIDVERFGLIVGWFGPFSPSQTGKGNIYQKMESILKETWFHGDITSQEAEKILMSESFGGQCDWLVRASLSAPQNPFTISRKQGTDPEHYRISYDFVSGFYSLQCKTKTDAQHNLSAGSLVELVSKAKGLLGLKLPIPCQKFQSIFSTTHETTSKRAAYKIPEMWNPPDKNL
jgi:serine/threonine protein kinase